MIRGGIKGAQESKRGPVQEAECFVGEDEVNSARAVSSLCMGHSFQGNKVRESLIRDPVLKVTSPRGGREAMGQPFGRVSVEIPSKENKVTAIIGPVEEQV